MEHQQRPCHHGVLRRCRQRRPPQNPLVIRSQGVVHGQNSISKVGAALPCSAAVELLAVAASGGGSMRSHDCCIAVIPAHRPEITCLPRKG